MIFKVLTKDRKLDKLRKEIYVKCIELKTATKRAKKNK